MIGSKHDWYNLNTLRSYPLEYSSQPVAITGFVLPDTLLSECFVILQSDNVTPALSSVHFSGRIVTVSFVDSLTNNEIFMAQSTLTEDYQEADIIDLSEYGITGKITFGEVTPLKKMSYSGVHEFLYSRPLLSSHCFMCAGGPVIPSISANIDKIYGNVKIRATGELVATVVESDPLETNGVTEYTIVLTLKDPSKFEPLCLPSQSVCDCTFTPMGRINTVTPDINGNIKIIAADDMVDIVLINQINNMISISVVDTSENVCPVANIPFADGRLPSESDLTS